MSPSVTRGPGPHECLNTALLPFSGGGQGRGTSDEFQGVVSELATNVLKSVPLSELYLSKTLQVNSVTCFLSPDCFSPRHLLSRRLFLREVTVTHFGFLFLDRLFRCKRRLIYNDFKNTPSYSLYQSLAEGGSTAERVWLTVGLDLVP